MVADVFLMLEALRERIPPASQLTLWEVFTFKGLTVLDFAYILFFSLFFKQTYFKTFVVQ